MPFKCSCGWTLGNEANSKRFIQLVKLLLDKFSANQNIGVKYKFSPIR